MESGSMPALAELSQPPPMRREHEASRPPNLAQPTESPRPGQSALIGTSCDAAHSPGEPRERDAGRGGSPLAEDSDSAPERKGISLTPKALEMAKRQLSKRGTPEGAIRLGLRGGGCSGFTYVLEFADGPARPRDRVFEFDGLRIYVDPKSMIYLAGTVLDWEQKLMRQGFAFRNPNQASGCSCGHSFSV